MIDKEFSPIVISGPSGSGKTELIEYLKKKSDLFEEAPGITTRERRPGEVGNTDFITLNEFYSLIKHNELIQYAKYNGNYYGTLKSALNLLRDKQVLFNMGLDGTRALKKIRPDSSLLYILPPTKEELLRRMGNRDIKRYALGIEQTMNSIDLYNYLLISYTNKLDLLYDDFMDVFYNNENSKEKSLTLTKNKDFMRNFYK